MLLSHLQPKVARDFVVALSEHLARGVLSLRRPVRGRHSRYSPPQWISDHRLMWSTHDLFDLLICRPPQGRSGSASSVAAPPYPRVFSASETISYVRKQF
ncbi:hypothetical protein EVAR_8786_1 [Eumeta japonica]|uniref:Uncharacterized protein n=1 Tax=Eumeta variegata TaxID=151549 RepID=A0A4C1TTV7_EUMVA|nr:hypothetical protein EVAR_8786_1 [Eumeta japonica]